MKPEELNRLSVVHDLINFVRPIEEISTQLGKFGWDYDEVGVELKRQHLQSILDRYSSGELQRKDVEMWANCVESREDVYFETPHDQLIQSILYELANPYLTLALDPARAKYLFDSLAQG